MHTDQQLKIITQILRDEGTDNLLALAAQASRDIADEDDDGAWTRAANDFEHYRTVPRLR
jgi:hypothetical protein